MQLAYNLTNSPSYKGKDCPLVHVNSHPIKISDLTIWNNIIFCADLCMYIYIYIYICRTDSAIHQVCKEFSPSTVGYPPSSLKNIVKVFSGVNLDVVHSYVSY